MISTPHDAVRATAGMDAPATATVRYDPGDCALLVGPAELVLRHRDTARVAGLRAVLLCTGQGDADRLAPGMRALAGQLDGASGWMGRFTARMRAAGGPVDLAPLSLHADGHFDWIIEFRDGEGPGPDVLPPGHYRLPTDDYPALKGTLLEIARRTREGFDKPRYFHLEEGLCAHRRQGITGCSACLSVCAAGAISSGKESIAIEPHLCQGCGSCALVCPTGAVRFAHPDLADSLRRLKDLLRVWRETGEDAPGVWIVAGDGASTPRPGWLPFPTRAPASLGLEFWLAALAGGCRRVAITPGPLPETSRTALLAQMQVARALLAGLGLPAAIGHVADPDGIDALPSLATPCIDVVETNDKRVLLDAALRALTDSAAVDAIEVPLPAGAPLGAVVVDATRCTLCAVCIRVCPTEALAHPGSLSQLAFTESRCTQCGLCVSVCPEDAVSLRPRLLVAESARQGPRVIAEAEMFACPACGKAFAPRAMVERSRAMMADHPMFQGERAKLMELCPDCRQRTMAGVAA